MSTMLTGADLSAARGRAVARSGATGLVPTVVVTTGVTVQAIGIVRSNAAGTGLGVPVDVATSGEEVEVFTAGASTAGFFGVPAATGSVTPKAAPAATETVCCQFLRDGDSGAFVLARVISIPPVS